MAKRPPLKQPKANLGTYFLAKNSRLFRPGAELILATAPQLNGRKSSQTQGRTPAGSRKTKK